MVSFAETPPAVVVSFGRRSSDINLIFSGADRTMAGGVHFAEVAGIEVEVHDGARVRSEMYPLEAFETAQWIAAARGRDEVEFGDLVAGAAARCS